jgi:ankyrin repeat protein
MGNRSSSVQPSGPPPLLSAAVVGDVAKFGESWTGENSIDVRDAQENNVLHALFSCRVCVENNTNSKCSEILNRIHNSLPSSRWKEAYRARNAIGCTPLWILVAYGNVALLKEAKQKFADDNDDDAMDDFLELLRQPNKQGDSPLLATCSQGNTDMVCYLKEELLSPDQFNAAISESNHNGTTPLQIIVGNNHASLLEFVLRERGTALHSQFLEYNKAGLSLFHICSERNAHEILRTMLTFMTDTENSKADSEALNQVLSLKDKNGANALHVAAFCGNTEAVQVWIDVIKETAHSGSKDTTESKESTTTIAMLDQLDGQSRTAYWLGMVRGRDAIGTLLADEGVDTTSNPKMVKEIEEAQERRTKAATARQQPNRTIDGSALLDR